MGVTRLLLSRSTASRARRRLLSTWERRSLTSTRLRRRRRDQTDPPSSDAFGARSPALTVAVEPLGPRSESHFQPRLWAPSAVSCSILAGSRSVPTSLGTLATYKQL